MMILIKQIQNMETLNIVQLIEKNAITRLSRDYENKLINKIKDNFTESQQQIFLGSFYTYLKYDTKKDFVIDFDKIWTWVGFTRKDNAKTLLKKFFTLDIDYRVEKAAPASAGAGTSEDSDDDKETKNLGGAGLNKEKILLTVNTFKKFCLKAGTKKADEIHDYYIKLEELLQETISEETNELRLQLTNKNEELVTKDQEVRKEKMIRKNMKAKYECYLERRIDIDNKYQKGAVVYIVGFEEIPLEYKIGCTFNLKRRLGDYHSVCPYEPILHYKKYLTFDNSTSIDEKFQLLVEQMLHHILRKFRTKHSKEWFRTDDLSIFVKELDDLALFLQKKDESFRDAVSVKESPKEILKKIKNEPIENVIKNEENEELEEELSDDEVECEEEDEVDEVDEEESKSERELSEDEEEVEVELEDNEETETKPTIVLIDDTKKCTKCKLHLSKDCFAKSPGKKDDLDSKCKECKKKQYMESKKKKKLVLDEKECTKCNVLKKISEFYNRVGSSDGKTSECKDCTKGMYNNRFEQRTNTELIEVTEKTCKNCNTLQTIENFHKKTDSPDGHKPFCKTCCSELAKNERKKPKVVTITTKTCNKCSIELPINEFWNSKMSKDGKDHRCIKCHKNK